MLSHSLTGLVDNIRRLNCIYDYYKRELLVIRTHELIVRRGWTAVWGNGGGRLKKKNFFN